MNDSELKLIRVIKIKHTNSCKYDIIDSNGKCLRLSNTDVYKMYSMGKRIEGIVGIRTSGTICVAHDVERVYA